MSKGQVCDNCEAVETNFTEIDLYWLQVGFLEGPKWDACTLACALALLDEQVRPAIQKMEVAGAAP